MSIPDYQTLMLPFLRYAGERPSATLREATDALSQAFELTNEERKELLPSGRQATIANRVGWARTYLAKAGLVSSPKRGVFEITAHGRREAPTPSQGVPASRYFPETSMLPSTTSVPSPTTSRTESALAREAAFAS